jgi:hypothetical protein
MRYLNQLLLNWMYLQKDIQQNVAMGSDWQNGFLMEALSNFYYLLGDQYPDPAHQNYGLKDSVMLYLKVYAERKYGVSTSNASIGYAFLSSEYGDSFLSKAAAKMLSFPPYRSFVIRDFAETGRSLEMSMFYFAVPESVTIGVEDKQDNPAGLEVKNLLTILPNPFNPAVKIMVRRYAYGVQRVSSQIYDISGKLVKDFTPYASRITPYTFTWNAFQHPSGVYILKATLGNRTLTKKLVLQK